MAKAPEHRYTSVQTRTLDVLVRRFGRLPPSPHSLWFVLLTSDHTLRLPGVLRTGRSALAESLDWTIEEFDACWKPLDEAGMVESDWKARLIYLPKAFKQGTNHPSSTASAVAWRREVNDLPDCKLARQIDRDIRGMLTDTPALLASYVACKRSDQKAKPTEDAGLPAASPTHSAAPLPAASAAGLPAASAAPSPGVSLSSPLLSSPLQEETLSRAIPGPAPPASATKGQLSRIWDTVVLASISGNPVVNDEAIRLVNESARRRNVDPMQHLAELAKAFVELLADWKKGGKITRTTTEKFVEHFTLVVQRLAPPKPAARRKTVDEPFESAFPDLIVPGAP